MKNIFIGILIFAILVSFGGGFVVGKAYSFVPSVKGAINLAEGQPEGTDFSLFWDAWRVVQEDYVGAGPLDFHKMVYGAIDGMIGSLGDPYTNFMTAQDTKMFLEDVEGSFSGVGMEIGMRDEKLKVIAPLEGTPAEQAGLRADDHIVRIDENIFTSDLTIDEAVSHIRGPEGSIVTLSIFRQGWSESKDFKIKRAVISIPSLRYELLASPGEAGGQEGNIAYVKIFQFSETLRADFRDVARKVTASGADKIILDLRNNPGGFLHVSVDIAGYFVDRGDIVVIEDFGDAQDRKEHKASGNSALQNFKVVVLINKGSASASEILAGALRDSNSILLIGEKSFGKGSVQEIKKLKDESSIKITIAKWLTPNGFLIAGEGLAPDIEVEITDEDFEKERDPQLDKAVEVLNNL